MTINQTSHNEQFENCHKMEEDFQLFYDAMQTATHGIIISDLNGYITNVNESLLRMYGGSDRRELLGKHVLDLLVEGDKDRAAQDSINLSKSGQSKTYQYIGLSKSGSEVPVEVTVVFIKDKLGKIIGFFDIVRSIGARNSMEEELRRNNRKKELIDEKLQVVGSLSRHDILNKLQIINTQIFLAKRKGTYEQAIQVIGDASNQIKDILMFSRHFERMGLEELQETDVDLVLREAISLFSDLKGITAVVQCKGLSVQADSLLSQVFCNLIDNTLKYGQKTTQFRASFEKMDGKYKLVFEDDGVGIPNSMKTQLFSRGFGKNTGLGLFLVKKIIEGYGWQVEEKGEETKGAKFVFIIPEKNVCVK